MNELLNKLIEALREELRQCGEMLARFDDLKEEASPHPHPDAAALASVSLRNQGMAIQNARRKREEIQRRLARELGQPEDREIISSLPPSYQLLARALLDENKALALLIRRRRQQRELSLRRSLYAAALASFQEKKSPGAVENHPPAVLAASG
jgi:hypothetical protein